MNTESIDLTENELFKKALLLAQRLKSSNLDKETILARLEKNGIPNDIANEALKNVLIEEKEKIKSDKVQHIKLKFNTSIIKIGIGVILAIISAVFLKTHIIIPIELIMGGIIAAFIAYVKLK
jgi:uncharacterized membrane protein